MLVDAAFDVVQSKGHPPTSISWLVKESYPPLPQTPCLCLLGMGHMHVPGIFGLGMCTSEACMHGGGQPDRLLTIAATLPH